MDKIDSNRLARIEAEMMAMRMALVALVAAQPGQLETAKEIKLFVEQRRKIHAGF